MLLPSPPLLNRYCRIAIDVLAAFLSLLNGLRLLGAIRLRSNAIVVLKHFLHHLLQLMSSLLSTTHCDQLSWPRLLHLNFGSCCHYDSARKRHLVVLQEFVVLKAHLGAEFGETFCMVRRLQLQVKLACSRLNVVAAGVQENVCGEDDTLAEEVSEDVVDGDVLDFPVEGVQHVCFHAYKVTVGVGKACDVYELLEPGIGLL